MLFCIVLKRLCVCMCVRVCIYVCMLCTFKLLELSHDCVVDLDENGAVSVHNFLINFVQMGGVDNFFVVYSVGRKRVFLLVSCIYFCGIVLIFLLVRKRATCQVRSTISICTL